MHKRRRHLAHHLVGVVLIKLVVLLALWWVFIAPQRQRATAAEVSVHLVGVSGSQTTEK